jgi:four helix bundle protein
MKLTRFEDLECWQEARRLVNGVYKVIQNDGSFQKDFRLAGQISGAAISVMNNIAEGWASQSNAEFIRFLTYSRRSCAETQNCLYIALDQRYIDEPTFKELYAQCSKVIQINDGLLRYLRSHRSERSKRSQRSQRSTYPARPNPANPPARHSDEVLWPSMQQKTPMDPIAVRDKPPSGSSPRGHISPRACPACPR